jgi:CubicO group peptidase (beta-lactamase class C family)
MHLPGKSWMIALVAMTAFAQGEPKTPYWPTGKWRTASPESQGLDSQVLASVIDEVVQKQLGVHSLLVIRHGYAVLDAYFYPYDGNSPHDLASVTKTVTSVLTGIAVDRGVIKLDQPLLSFFANEAPKNPDDQKRKITVGDLLRMESGLDCGYTPGELELEQMKRSPNWVQFALALPMKYEPGTHSSYCSPGYHLLGSVIASAAHMSELEFGRKYLFEPLGIQGVVWADDPQGRSHGWGDSHLLPQDVAKIGYLYLNGGNWNGTQIVPASWVTMSTTPRSGARGEPGGLGYEWGASNGPNGRQFGGTGRGGQTLIVWPDLDMVVVSTAGGNTGQINQMVRQAVKSNQALPANGDAYTRLENNLRGAAKAPPTAVTATIPPMANSISGVVYEFPVNSSRLDSLSLSFSKAGESTLVVKYYGQLFRFPVGLDGTYRVSHTGPFQLIAGAMGKWTGDSEFLLDLNFIANINHYTLDIKFHDDQIDVTANEASGLIRNGHLTGTRSAATKH